MEIFGTYLGILIGLIGLGVGFWQNRQKTQFEKIVRANSWFNYQRASNANGTVQLALKKYKQIHSNDISSEVIEELARADAFGQEVFKESIRQIHFSESSFKNSDIEQWESEGKISEAAKPLFKQLADKDMSTKSA
ncbi:hypothetical protein JC525_19745 [Alteromonas sp. IB21]|uniref:hypothetical protein n=1 Tax=Alteromonas sp. IB21 TaxID=2779369 RepID=UPI0018E75762|nr:hypothetical protein [Alteromonas sp. IB21]MBJ2131150.1 hypothetical protein [Alteromonas sp. IB21]